MWGNRLGWGISAAIVVAVAGLMYLLVRMDTVSPPTAEFTRVHQASIAGVRLPADPLTVLPAMTADTDAAPAYRKALELFNADRSLYETFPQTVPSGRYDGGALKAVAALREGTAARRMRLFADDPAEIVRYDSVDNPVTHLKIVANAGLHLALLEHHHKRPREAMGIAEAVFSAGVKMFDERVTYLQLQAGMEMMSGGAKMIEIVSRELKDTARADAAATFAAELADYQRYGLDPVVRAVTSIDPKVVAAHAGDVFALAERSDERMWRVEAILKLGRMRYSVGEGGRVGDQKGAMRRARRYAEDPDKSIRAAGVRARDLTAAEYHAMR